MNDNVVEPFSFADTNQPHEPADAPRQPASSEPLPEAPPGATSARIGYRKLALISVALATILVYGGGAVFARLSNAKSVDMAHSAAAAVDAPAEPPPPEVIGFMAPDSDMRLLIAVDQCTHAVDERGMVQLTCTISRGDFDTAFGDNQ